MECDFVNLTKEGVPFLRLYSDGRIVDTRTGSVLPLKKHAVNPAVEFYRRDTGKSVYLCIPKLLRRYFDNELMKVPKEDRRNLAFMCLSNYSVTRDGRIWSHIQESWMNPKAPNSHGYITLHLATDDGCNCNHKLHRVIAKAFVPNPHHYKEVDHIDGNKFNNSADNLEWVSTFENLRRAREKGLRPQAVTEEEVHFICEKIIEGYSDSDIATMVDTYPQIITHIRKGNTHQNISSLYGIEPKRYQRNVPIDYTKYRKHWKDFKVYKPKNSTV